MYGISLQGPSSNPATSCSYSCSSHVQHVQHEKNLCLPEKLPNISFIKDATLPEQCRLMGRGNWRCSAGLGRFSAVQWHSVVECSYRTLQCSYRTVLCSAVAFGDAACNGFLLLPCRPGVAVIYCVQSLHGTAMQCILSVQPNIALQCNQGFEVI